MATPTIPNGEEYFFPIIYEGNGAGQRVGKFVPFTDQATVANSCIFNDGDSPQLERTPSSNGNRRTFTVSAWVKRGVLGAEQHICSSYDGSSSDNNSMWEFRFLAANTISISRYTDNILITNRTFEDTSKFYHLLMAVDTTQGTASNRVKLYVDGDEITSFGTDVRSSVAQDFDTAFNNTADACVVGNRKGDSKYFDGYLAEVNLVDGLALTPDTFGVTDTSTGRWIPKTLTGITYGTNGFRLQFGSSSALGDDTSGNNNDFSVSNLVAGDQTTDSPTQNHAVLASNPTAGTATLSEGNLKIAGTGSSVYGVRRATFLINSNDSNGYYFEAKNVGSSRDNINIGLISSQNALSASAYGGSNSYGIASRGSGGSNQYWRVLGGSTDVTTSVSHASDDVIGVAIKEGKIWFAINNTYVLSGDPAAGTNAFFDMSSKASQFQIAFNVFQNNTLDVNFGQKSLAYSAPTGFSALQQDNLPETAKGVSSFVWIKSRDTAYNHISFDSSQGVNVRLLPSATNSAVTAQDTLNKFLKGGFQTGSNSTMNSSGDSLVAWNWVANGGTTASNGDGSISSTVQANTTAGFSIVKYTGTGSAGTVGHGLSSAPEWIFGRPIEQTGGYNWSVYHKSMTSASYYLSLNLTSAESSNSNVWGTAPSSSVISVGTSMSASTEPMILYCWHGVDGFSKFGEYVGTGNANGPFVYLGFRPALIIIKNRQRATNWHIYDTQRGTFNPTDKHLYITSAAEVTGAEAIDILSNGFKLRSANAGTNRSGEANLYMAFAEHPFVGDGTNPVTAR